MEQNKLYDAIIIGGSYAGLSAAMSLGRSLRHVLIIDSNLPCNRQTPHSQNFITHDGAKPHDISQKAKEQVLKYNTVKFLEDLAIGAKQQNDHFEIITQSGALFHSKKLLFATGIKDTMPSIKGFDQCWGISVIHCPYCHGYEVRGKKTAILSNADKAMHITSLVNNLTKDITIITSGKAEFSDEQLQKIKKHNIKILETEVSEIKHTNGYIQDIMFSDGTIENFDAMYATLPFTQHSDLPALLGCEMTDTGHLKIDALQKTTIPGIYACGDNSNMMRSVANAVSAGTLAGAMLNKELIDEQF